MRSTRCLFLLLGLIAPVLSRGAADWTKMKAGITTKEAAETMGMPLLQTSARGFQVWIYDGCGEIVFRDGPALGWTKPAPTPESLSRPVALDVIFRPAFRLPTLRSINTQRPIVPTYEDPFDTRFRYRQ